MEDAMARNWIAVASAEHIRRGGIEGFMQVCHGRAAPLRRVQPGDRIAYYSPTIIFRGKDKYQAFTRYGIVRAGEPYQVDMGEGFCPFRRDVDWVKTQDAPIAPLRDTLEFTRGKRNWGAPFRYGIFAVSAHDMDVIAHAMGVERLAAA
jgi:hypothetical protein